MTHGLTADDLVIALISGGGRPQPAGAGLSLADKQQLNRQLLACGASIHEMKHAAQAPLQPCWRAPALACAPAPVHTLVISDVPGDGDPAVIASGPDGSMRPPAPMRCPLRRATACSCRRLRFAGLQSAAFETPSPVTHALPDTVCSSSPRPAKAWRPQRFWRAGRLARRAARRCARRRGIVSWAPSTPRWPVPRLHPCLLLGGETTVTPPPFPRGGRAPPNTCWAVRWRCRCADWALAADTDGIDGVGPMPARCCGRTARAAAHGGSLTQRPASMPTTAPRPLMPWATSPLPRSHVHECERLPRGPDRLDRHNGPIDLEP